MLKKQNPFWPQAVAGSANRTFGRTTLYLLTLTIVAAVAWSWHAQVEVAVRASGIVKPTGDAVHIVNEVAGRVRVLPVHEGADVRMGDTIMQLDTRESMLKRATLLARIHSSETRLEHLRASLALSSHLEDLNLAADLAEASANRRSAEAGLEEARVKWNQSEQLFHEGLLSRMDLESARSTLERADAEDSKWLKDARDLKRAQADARLREHERDVESMEAELAELYGQLSEVQLAMERLTITSPSDGRITSLTPLHPGEAIGAGTAIASLTPAMNDLIVESWLPASERRWVREGAAVRIQPDSSPVEVGTFDGTIASISPDVRIENSAAAYRVVISTDPNAPPLQLGTTFHVHFITRQERVLWLLFDRIRAAIEGD